MEKIRLFSMFSGYGGAEFALKKANIPFECVGFSEIDTYAILCYRQNHWMESAQFPDGTVTPHNYGDATKINPNDIPNFDLLTGGFPCQAFSVAGKGLGELDTRGTLFNEIIRIAEVKKPRWMLLENVKGLTTKTHKATFEKILSELSRIGYHVKWKVLNSKKHGTPQNRERVFFVCFRDFSDFEKFSFPQEQPLNLFLKDILEKDVDSKYYLSEEQQARLLSKARSFNERFIKNNYSSTLCARDYKDPKVIQIGEIPKEVINDNERQRRVYSIEGVAPSVLARQDSSKILQLNNPAHSNDRIYSTEGVSPSLNTMQGGNRQPFIVASRGRNPNNPSDRTTGAPTEQRLEPNTEGTSNALTSVQKDNWVFDGKIRKLTPTECFRLMGFFNDEINLDRISNTQRYKLAGNGFDINLVSQIFLSMFKGVK